MKNLLSALTVATTLAGATIAQADGLYLGFGLGYAQLDSKADGPAGTYGSGASELKAPMVGLTAGYRWDLSSGFAAVEGNIDLSTKKGFTNTVNGNACPTPGATGAYYCSHKSTIRLRGIYGMPVGTGWELYGALGVGAMVGDGATDISYVDKGMNVGVTAGLGVQRDLGRGKLRVELVYDNFNTSKIHPTVSLGGLKYDPTYKATSFMASYIFQF